MKGKKKAKVPTIKQLKYAISNKEIETNSIEVEIRCKCGKAMGWITEGKKTQPCPFCSRVYIGKYNAKKLSIDIIEVKRMLG